MKLINADKVIETLKTRKKLFCRNQIEFRMLSPDQKSRVDEIDICIAELVNAEEVQTTDTDSDTISRAKAIEALMNALNDVGVLDAEDINTVFQMLPPAQPEIIRCKDCKHWIPYDWMFSEVWRSKNMADYPEDEIGCNYCDTAMKANDFCSRGERRE